MRTRGSGSFGGRLTEARTRQLELNDDIVQQRFADRDGFAAAFAKERDLLYAAANEPDAKRRRALAKDALRAIRERRVHYFQGEDVFYAELEEIFLGMEGVANWAGFRAAMHAGLSRDEAITLMQGSRNGSRRMKTALFWAIDSLKPAAERIFREKPVAAFRLLE